MKVKFEQEIEVSDERIGDLICCGLEGGSNYWIGEIKAENPDNDPRFKFYSDVVNAKRGALIITDGYGDEGPKRVDRSVMEQALQLMASTCPSHFKDFIEDNDDAETGDVFLQLCCFGELVYG